MSKREEKSTKKRKLTAAEKKEIRAIMERARGDGKPHTAQDTLPFRQMYPDGLCKLDNNTWSKCIEFEDVNYQLAQPDQQTAIFEGLCDLYNSHDSSIGMEISLPCRHMNQEDFLKRIEIAAQGDAFDGIRQLYTQMLRRQLEKGNNGIVKTKLLVLTIEESDIRAARARFARIIMDALNHFKVMGALAKVLDGREWLELLHGILHPDGERFSFDWDWLAPSGLHVKDFIAPSAFRFASARQFQMGTKFCAACVTQIVLRGTAPTSAEPPEMCSTMPLLPRYVGKYSETPPKYEIPDEVLADETFSALITEAEKYIGMPYVWGGSNPNTSFDCSGFICWSMRNSGVWNVSRTSAQGLYNLCTPVSKSNAQPGDLIFFKGTYDTPGISHVGLYVGAGKMLHCGDPIRYVDINTAYWQAHFYAFARPPYQ